MSLYSDPWPNVTSCGYKKWSIIIQCHVVRCKKCAVFCDSSAHGLLNSTHAWWWSVWVLDSDWLSEFCGYPPLQLHCHPQNQLCFQHSLMWLFWWVWVNLNRKGGGVIVIIHGLPTFCDINAWVGMHWLWPAAGLWPAWRTFIIACPHMY